MTRARVDKDRSDYLSKTARPDGESGTAYWSNKSIEGDKEQAAGNGGKIGDADRNGNKIDVYTGGTKKDTSRIADRPLKMVAGETGIGDTGTGLGEDLENPDELSKGTLSSYVKYAGGRGLNSAGSHGIDYGVKAVNNHFSQSSRDRSLRKALNRAKGVERAADRLAKEEINPFAKVLAKKFGLHEDENPGVASSPSTSDNPSLGMAPINNTDFRSEKPDVKGLLESIALQAAESFELMDDNKQIPPAVSSQLENCQNILNKFYNMMTNSSSDNSADSSDTPPVQKDTAERKPAVNESYYVVNRSTGGVVASYQEKEKVDKHARESNYRGGASYNVVHSDNMKKEEAELEEKLIGNQDKIDANHNGKLDANDFKKLRSKKTMKEATDIVFRNLLKDKFDANY